MLHQVRLTRAEEIYQISHLHNFAYDPFLVVIIIIQAANDGFRGVYMLCFEGPDAGKGFVILSNGDNPSVYMQCELCRVLLTTLRIEGVDFNRIKSNNFNMAGLKQETIVNLGAVRIYSTYVIKHIQHYSHQLKVLYDICDKIWLPRFKGISNGCI